MMNIGFHIGYKESIRTFYRCWLIEIYCNSFAINDPSFKIENLLKEKKKKKTTRKNERDEPAELTG